MSDPPAEACTGYWYDVNVKTPTAGPAWKCITQAEYDQVMAQQAQADQQGGLVVLIIFGVVVACSLFAIAVVLIKRLINRAKPAQKD